MFKAIALIPLITASFSTTPNALAQNQLVSSKFIQKTETDILLDVPFVHQVGDLKDTEDEWAGGSACGPAALTMVMNEKGGELSLQTVVNRLPANVYIKGNMFYNLSAGPKIFGYEAKEIEINTKQIFETLESGNPIVMNIQNYDGIVGHAIVVVGIKGFDGEKAQALIAHDPFKAPYQTFEYINEKTLKQESGWINPIGIIKPFYVTKYSLASTML